MMFIVKPSNFYRLIYFKPFAHYNLKIKSRLPEDHVWEKQYVVFREKCIYFRTNFICSITIEQFHLERNQGDLEEFLGKCLKNIIKVRRFLFIAVFERISDTGCPTKHES